jgi:inhibitor of KinA
VSFAEARLFPLGDCALVIDLGNEIGEATHARVRAVVRLLESEAPKGMVEYIPAFTNVTVIYDPYTTTHHGFSKRMRALLQRGAHSDEALDARLVEIPVCYGGGFGPDLDFVASSNQLDAQEVIAIHAEPDYLVYMIGFVPGFPYLGGMSDRIAAPRRESPRHKIPAGSVGIAGRQTGIYSIESPGGWQLIGRTPLRLFRPDDEEPSLLRAGDRVRFKAISRDQYGEMKGRRSP